MMLAARGAFLAARRKPKLPYDAEVEYIESTGTQWIDTGVFPDNNIQTNIEFMVLGNNTSYDCVAACEGNSVFYWICARAGDYNRYLLNSSNSGVVFKKRALNVKNHVIFNADGNMVIINGETSKLGSVSKKCSSTIALWAEHIGTTALFKSIARIYSVLINDRSNGRSLRDFVAVRFTNEQGQSEGAMYDRVSGQLFRNSGTGAFGIGADK